MKRLHALLTPLVLVCAAQIAHAQTNKGAIAIEDCTAFESNMLGTAPASRQIQIKKGEIFSLGRLLPLPDFHHTIRDKGLMRVYYIQSPGSQAQKHIWIPEASVKEFDADAGGILGKATVPWTTSQGERGPRWNSYFADAARVAASGIPASAQAAQPQQAASAQAAAARATAAPAAPEPTLTGGPGVYLVMKDKVWKDGKEFPLAYGSEASSLFVSGDDLYVAGNSEGDSFGIATVWKNGAAQKLDTVSSNATAVFVSGDDVYVAGTRGSGEGRRPVLWKNGEMQTLSEKTGGESWMPTHVSVWGKDVYVAGYRVRDPYIGDYVAMLWKNGKESVHVQPAPNSAVKLSDMTILVSSGSVYVSATEKFGSGLKIWKDGRPVPGLKLGQEAKSTQVLGNFVYYLEDDKLLRNGVEQKLETFENPESLAKISTPLSHVFVSGNDVYVLGLRQSYYAAGKSHEAVKVLWKNGKAQVLDASQYLMVQSFFVAN